MLCDHEYVNISGGNYCGGWAGNCGDGGVGGSSWYLICEKCRQEQMKKPKEDNEGQDGDEDDGRGDKDILRRKMKILALSPIKQQQQQQQSPVEFTRSHQIMHNNAMFLLDLANNPNCHQQHQVSHLDLYYDYTVTKL